MPKSAKRSKVIARQQHSLSPSTQTQLSLEQLEARQLLTTTPGLPWLENTQLIDPSDFDADDSSGLHVAIGGDTVVFGSAGDDDAGVDAGAAYVFVRDDAGTPADLEDDTWLQQAKLVASDATAQDGFGGYVVIQGDTLVVSAGQGASGGNGAAYVFQRSGTTWYEAAKLTAFAGAPGDQFGKLAIDGDTIVVGATQTDPNGNQSGKAYVFVRPQGGWAGDLNETAELIPANVAPGDRMGRNVAVLGNTVLVGADQKNSDGNGKVFVFERLPSSDWVQTATLTANDGAIGDQFGNEIALDGNRAIITAHRDDHSGIVNAGSAYVFERNASGAWTQTTKLTASDPGTSDEFGRGVDIEGDTIVVGAWSGEIETANSGSVYFFQHDGGGTWTEIGEVTASDANLNEAFGSLDLQGDELVVGNFARDQNRGSVFLFSKSDSSIVASDLFESGSFSGGLGQWSAGSWTVSGDANIQTGAEPHSGSYHARLRRSSGDLRRVVDVTGLTDVRLRFWSKLNSFEGSDQARVRVSGNGSSWTTLTTFADGQDDNQYHFFELEVPDVGDTLHVRFDAAMSGKRDYWYIDNVEVTGRPASLPPVADDDAYVVAEDGVLNVAEPGVLANDSDTENDPLTAVLAADAAHGELSFSADGSFTYTPDPDFFGVDSFTYRANDGTSSSAAATVNIAVSPINDAPRAGDQAIETEQDTPVDIVLTGSDVDGDALTFEVVDDPSNGTLSGASPNLTYTPGPGYSGPDSFTFQVNDGTVDSSLVAVSITVNEVNHPPVANDLSVATDEDVPAAVTLSGSDSDGDALSFEILSGPARGSLSGEAPNLTYTPDENYNGADSITYRANDGQEPSLPATVSIGVAAVNDAPVAADDSYSLDQDSALNVTVLGVLANDNDVDGDSLSATLVAAPASGSLTLYSDGSFSYAPNTGFVGADSFSYSAYDGSLSSAPATVSLDVSAAAADVLFVYDIRCESIWGGWYRRAEFEIRSDSDFDGFGSAADDVAAGVAIEVEFAGRTYSGTTNANGEFRSSWLRGTGSGTVAEVTDLALEGFVWTPLDLDREDDSDFNELPDAIV